MGCHTVIYGLHNRADTMTLREEIIEKRKEFWKEADTSQMGEELELIIDRIDELENRMDRIEFSNKVVTTEGMIRIRATPEPSESFPGYNELMKETIPVLKAAIAEKKRELDQKEYIP